MTRIVLTGSYNGQDSLGDECLLRAVVHRLRALEPACDIEVQLHGTDTAFSRRFADESGTRLATGLQTGLWRLAHVARRLRLPARLADNIALAVGPIAGALGWSRLGRPMAALRNADLFFIYGGTQFSGQWYRLNAPAYLWSARVVKRHGGRVVFGPQQYGPLSSEDARELRGALAEVVDDWRTRNTADLEMFAVDAGERARRLVYDEVFSAVGCYPSLHRHAADHLLVNLRAMSFDDDIVLAAERYAGFAALLDRLMLTSGLPVVFFGVSDGSFCDDDAAFRAIRSRVSQPDRLSTIGRIEDEHALFRLAQRAQLVVSMSFHGCILSGIAGAPFVPVTEGRYYDHKYVDFDRYTGGQGVPLLALSDIDPDADADRIEAYVRRFDVERVRAARVMADRQLDAFYRGILSGA
jgi:polysaccharide pyruvyl transferase WcaK-like protein